MGICTNWIVSSVFILVCAHGQDFNEERHKYQFATQMGRLKEIPRRFEAKGENAVAEFKKYINDVQGLARKENVTVAFKIKAEVFIPKPKLPKKEMLKKIKTKKYNVPLKKKNMKLSNFEIILRRRANDHVNMQQHYEVQPVTTEKQHNIFYSTKPAWIGKYKPIIGQVKTNYTKFVRPVRNKVITLFV